MVGMKLSMTETAPKINFCGQPFWARSKRVHRLTHLYTSLCLIIGLLSSCDSTTANYSGPTLRRGDVVFDQATDEPLNGVLIQEVEVWIYETEFKDGRKHGKEKVFLTNGQLTKKTNFENGLKEGLEEHFNDGILHISQNYKSGRLHGQYRRYRITYPYSLVAEGLMVDGKREGPWIDESNIATTAEVNGAHVLTSGTGLYSAGYRVSEQGNYITFFGRTVPNDEIEVEK